MKHGEPIFDESAHRTAPRVLGDARLSLDEENRLGECCLQAHRLVEQSPVTDRRAQVGGALALDRQAMAQHVVTDRQVRQLDVEAGGHQGVRYAASSFTVVDQHRTRLVHVTDGTRRGIGSCRDGYRRNDRKCWIDRGGHVMPAGDIETYHVNGKWRNRVEALGELPGAYSTKEEAVRNGRDEARERKVEHLIRNLDGTIRERNTYGHDPRDIPG